MEAFFAAVTDKSGYEKWKVNEAGVFYFTFSLLKHRKIAAGAAGLKRENGIVVYFDIYYLQDNRLSLSDISAK